MADVISGHMELMTGNLPGPLPQIKAGKVRGLAVTSAKRSPQAPDISTVAEQGVPGFDVSSWYGICTQAAVQKPIFDKLRADLLKTLANPDVRSEDDLRELYKRIGRENRAMSASGWETEAAQQVGYGVRRELFLGRGNTVARREAERKGAIR